MKILSRRQRDAYERTRIVPPEGYERLSTEQRRSFVMNELQTGDYTQEKALALSDIFYFAGQSGCESPEVFLYQILLGERDPAQAERLIEDENDALFFAEAFGFEHAKSFMSNCHWLEIYDFLSVFEGQDFSQEDVKLLLESRGVENVAAEVTTKSQWLSYVQIFGGKASRFVPKEVASKIKGRHLEDELGL